MTKTLTPTITLAILVVAIAVMFPLAHAPASAPTIYAAAPPRIITLPDTPSQPPFAILWSEGLENYPVNDCGSNFILHIGRLRANVLDPEGGIDPCLLGIVSTRELVKRALQRLLNKGIELQEMQNGKAIEISKEELLKPSRLPKLLAVKEFVVAAAEVMAELETQWGYYGGAPWYP